MATDPYAALGMPVAKGDDPYASLGAPASPDQVAGNGTAVAQSSSRTYQTTDPHGKTVQFLVPDNASDDQIRQAAADALGNKIYLGSSVQHGTPKPTDTSRISGLAQATVKPLINAGNAVESIPYLGDALRAGDRALGLETGDQLKANNQAALANNSRGGFQTAGELLGTLPLLRLPGGPVTQGLASGALLSDRSSPLGVGLDAAIGGLGSFAGAKLLQGIGSAIAPRVPEAVAALRQAGVNLAPGQYLRALGTDASNWATRLASNLGASVEDHATSLPIVGGMIREARQGATDDFNRGAAAGTLGIMGEGLPEAIQTGHGTTGYLRARFNQNYADVLSRMQMIPDETLHNELAGVASRMTDGTMNADTARQLRQTMNSVLGYRLPAMQEVPGTPFVAQESGNLPAVINTGRDLTVPSTTLGPYGGQAAEGAASVPPPRARYMNGETLKAVDSDLRKRAGATQDPALKSALNDIRQSVRGAAARSSDPADASRLADIDNAYAHYAVIRNAASKADGGIYTPRQLDTSSRISDTSIAKGRSSEGGALFQNYAENGINVLQGKTGDSGTFTREATFNPYYWALGAAAAPAYAATRRAVPLLTRNAGPNAIRAAELLRSLSPAAAAVGVPAALNLLPNPGQ